MFRPGHLAHYRIIPISYLSKGSDPAIATVTKFNGKRYP